MPEPKSRSLTDADKALLEEALDRLHDELDGALQACDGAQPIVSAVTRQRDHVRTLRTDVGQAQRVVLALRTSRKPPPTRAAEPAEPETAPKT